MELDREMQDNYLLVIEARDNGSPSNVALTNVSILINDVNDNSPTFTQGAILSSDPVMVPEVRHFLFNGIKNVLRINIHMTNTCCMMYQLKRQIPSIIQLNE